VKRMGWLEGAVPGVARLRSRKLDVTRPLAWKRGNPTGVPLRSPRREAEKFSSARAASSLAHSKMSLGSSWRHPRPRLPSSLTGESSDFPFFQALNSLMKEKADQESEVVDGSHGSPLSQRDSRSADRASRLAFTRARWWFRVKRRAPAHLARKIFCVAFGSRANWNVTALEST
jgi:hypothetical protein